MRADSSRILKEVTTVTLALVKYPPGEISRNGFQRIGIRVPRVRAVLKQGYPFLAESAATVINLWDYIWKNAEYYEVAHQAIYYYQHKTLLREEFKKIKQWIMRCDCWEHSDDLSKIYAQVVEENTDLAELVHQVEIFFLNDLVIFYGKQSDLDHLHSFAAGGRHVHDKSCDKLIVPVTYVGSLGDGGMNFIVVIPPCMFITYGVYAFYSSRHLVGPLALYADNIFGIVLGDKLRFSFTTCIYHRDHFLANLHCVHSKSPA